MNDDTAEKKRHIENHWLPAVAQVIAARRKSGEPIAIWKNGKAVWEYPKSPNGVRERPAR